MLEAVRGLERSPGQGVHDIRTGLADTRRYGAALDGWHGLNPSSPPTARTARHQPDGPGQACSGPLASCPGTAT